MHSGDLRSSKIQLTVESRQMTVKTSFKSEDAMKSVVCEKAFDFSIRIVNLYKYLTTEKIEYILSKQVLRSGTSIGANIKEALQAQSRKDFLSKMNIALKEALKPNIGLNF